MNQRKTNNVLWYSLGLAVLLCIAFLVVATGTTLARYRVERYADLTFEVRPPEQIAIGTLRTVTAEEATDTLKEGDPIFDPNMKPQWTKTDTGYQLTLTVANGLDQETHSTRNQKLRLRMVGTLGLTVNQETQTAEDPETAESTETETEPQALTITLMTLPETEEGTDTSIQATQTRIISGTPLHTNVGDGWIFTFLDENGQEPVWDLPGGSLNYVTITITTEGAAVCDTALLWPQGIAEVSE